MYKRGDKNLREDVLGEGLVLWIDRTNIIYELDWYVVDDVTPDGRVSCHFWWFDGEKPRCARACLSPAVTRHEARELAMDDAARRGERIE